VPSQPPRPGCDDTNEVEDCRGPTVVWPAGGSTARRAPRGPPPRCAPWSILPVAVAAVGTPRQRRADVSPMNARYEQRSPRAAFHQCDDYPKFSASRSNYPLRCPRSGRSPSIRITGTAITRKIKPPWARRHWGVPEHGNLPVAIDRRDDQWSSTLHRRVDQQFQRSSAFSATSSTAGVVTTPPMVVTMGALSLLRCLRAAHSRRAAHPRRRAAG